MWENLPELKPSEIKPYENDPANECYVLLEGYDFYLVLNRRYEAIGKLSLLTGLMVMESEEFNEAHVKDNDWEDYEWPKGNKWLMARWYSVKDAETEGERQNNG